MKLALCYLIVLIMISVIIGFMKGPAIAFASFMGINIITAVVLGVVMIIRGSPE